MEYKYLAGGAPFPYYPALGDPKPEGGAKVLLLTIGGICIPGQWDDSGFYKAWAKLPIEDKVKEEALRNLKK